MALLSPLIFVPILTYSFGRQNYDWESMKLIRKGDDSDIATRAQVDLESIPGERRASVIEAEAEQKHLKTAAIIARSLTVFMTIALLVLWPMPMYGSGYIFSKKFFTGKFGPSHAHDSFPYACVRANRSVLADLPSRLRYISRRNKLPSSLVAIQRHETLLTQIRIGWVTVGILWLFCSAFCVVLFPLWQGRKTMVHTFKSMYLDATGKHRPTIHGRSEEVEDHDSGPGMGVEVEGEKNTEVVRKEK